MKNLTIQLPFNEVKLNALRHFLEEKDVFLEDELEQFLTGLYNRTVPKNLHGFFEAEAAKASVQARPRPAKKDKLAAHE
jgi:hypothetical protein